MKKHFHETNEMLGPSDHRKKKNLENMEVYVQAAAVDSLETSSSKEDPLLKVGATSLPTIPQAGTEILWLGLTAAPTPHPRGGPSTEGCSEPTAY